MAALRGDAGSGEQGGDRLPGGWTLARVRDVSGDREAVVLDADRTATWLGGPAGDDEALRPEIVIGFHQLCLLKPIDSDDWYMGSLNDDGTVDCWSAYSDFHEALRGL
ncbi:hypothetical protein [Streptomyces sp. PTY087I2]|uniref:hypothetical protein n=1 Tax=Streptomyces sp. PTY087I2 TaxID=1819298 RepID=UPI0008282032|nr:hypothetical protein [Streptomyces sp. PTY087I2]OCC10153.1 hypothetical protein A3Q37_03971 [Streptomyces sp. PTY087I2]